MKLSGLHLDRILILCVSLLSGLSASGQISSERIDALKASTAVVVSPTIGGFGTAFCVSDRGCFVTNSRFVRNAKVCQLVLNPGESDQEEVNAAVVRVDAEAEMAIRVAEQTEDGFSALELKSSSDTRETAAVLAVGFSYVGGPAFRNRQYPGISVIPGRVTSLQKRDGVTELLHVAASVNAGNAGGPLLNESGDVIGFIRSVRGETGVVKVTPISILVDLLDRPEVRITEPEIVTPDQSVRMQVVVTDFIPGERQYQVSLSVSSAVSDKRRIEMLSDDGHTFHADFVPRLNSREIPFVQAVAEFDSGNIRCRLQNVPIIADDQTLMLADILRVKTTEQGIQLTVAGRPPAIVQSLTGIPTEGSLGNTVLRADFPLADDLCLDAQYHDQIQYGLTVRDGDLLVSEKSGVLQYDAKTQDEIASAPLRMVISPGEFVSLDGELPDFLVCNSVLNKSGAGCRVPPNDALRTKHRQMLDMDFTFEALVTFEQDDKILNIGLGPGIEDRSYNGLTDSVYLRLHAPWHGVGGMDIQNWRYGQSPMNGKIDWLGTHLVRVSKKGRSVQFMVDPDHDGPSDDDMNLVIPNIDEFSPFLNRRNCPLFLSGTGTILKARLSLHPPDDTPPPDDTSLPGRLANSLPPFIETSARYQQTPDGGIRILAGGPMSSSERDFLNRDFSMDVLMKFEREDAPALIGIGAGRDIGDRNNPTDTVYLAMPAPQRDATASIRGGSGAQGQMQGKVSGEGLVRVRVSKLAQKLTFAIDPEDDGPSEDDVTVVIPNLKEFAPDLNSKNSRLFFGGGPTFLEASLLE